MIWEKKGCSGTITLSGQQEKKIDICFDIECRIDGTINIDVEPVVFKEEMFWLVEVFHKPSSDSTRLLLKGKTTEGHYISSDKIDLTQASPQSQGGGNL